MSTRRNAWGRWVALSVALAFTSVGCHGNDDEDDNEVELNGAPSGMSGSCPNLTFTLEGRTVTTGQDTDFRKGTCDEFKAATNVEAEGTLTGNTVAAKKVSIEKD